METIQLCDGADCRNEPQFSLQSDAGEYELCEECAEGYSDDKLQRYEQ